MDQPFLTASMMPTVDEKPVVGTSRWHLERYLNQFWWPGGFLFALPPSPALGTQGRVDGEP
jgi:hypothetical protein